MPNSPETLLFDNVRLVMPEEIVSGRLGTEAGRIQQIGETPSNAETRIDGQGGYLAPGFIDLHVHGGDGADFMDLTAEAFRTVCRCHVRHGTTALTPTSTVGHFADYVRFLEITGELRGTDTGGATILGGHLYGPFFSPQAKGCHPNLEFLTPNPKRDEELLRHAGQGLVSFTVAPELPGAERLIRSAAERGLLVTAGHSYAALPQVEAALGWGVRHIDHLFCAMSDRAKLRTLGVNYPMPGGVMEATLLFDGLSTEVIADGKHLTGDLLRLAHKVKGPDKLALVTDAMRAVDLPDGEYWFGPEGKGELVRRLDGVGVVPDGSALASGVMGMDHCVRTFHQLTGVPMYEVVRMASLTPAKILGIDSDFGSLAAGKRADLILFDADWQVRSVYVGGKCVYQSENR